MSKQITIIGGGIVGLSCAYYLSKEGHQVRLIDKSSMDQGASHVNAGYITPSHIIPLASPGIITKGLKWMFNPASPFYVKPRLDPTFLKWAWQFKRSATETKVNRAIPLIRDINLLSRELYEEMKAEQLFDFHYERNGLLMLCNSDKGLEAECKVGLQAKEAGLGVELLDGKAVKQYEPDVELDVKGAVYFDCDAHMTPGPFMKGMTSYLADRGVEIRTDETAQGFETKGGLIQAITTQNGRYPTDEVVLAAGAWSPNLAKQLKLNIPVQPGKGYRINVERPTGIRMPSILVESKVAVTPMDGFTRFAGTMELGDLNHKINPVRVQAIADAAQKYYPQVAVDEKEKLQAACGLRPCTPDGLPYIGRPDSWRNLVIATGHAMMGWSLGPATGKLVSEVVDGRPTSLDLLAYDPDRF